MTRKSACRPTCVPVKCPDPTTILTRRSRRGALPLLLETLLRQPRRGDSSSPLTGPFHKTIDPRREARARALCNLATVQTTDGPLPLSIPPSCTDYEHRRKRVYRAHQSSQSPLRLCVLARVINAKIFCLAASSSSSLFPFFFSLLACATFSSS
ncbi:hypothetical protein BC567DRAFT_238262 [Phyllosticta citribraziliensis]